MPEVLRFGISSLDELLGIPSEKDNVPHGVYLPKETVDPTAATTSSPEETEVDEEDVFTTSVCIIGPTGTGKSIFALHMASKYLADCLEEDKKAPVILYVSTDLTFKMAERAWKNFGLDYPYSRKDPFSRPLGSQTNHPNANQWIELKMCKPTELAVQFDSIDKEREENRVSKSAADAGGVEATAPKLKVIFVDMASYTAGDDWGFLHKLISLLPAPEEKEDPRHLVVVDAIEGFEALAGEFNAFGQKSTRRSRIAQVMRLITGKCHAMLVVEESTDYVKEEKLAEEFVADTVIRLDKLTSRNYERRVLTVEKVRGQSHIRGQHHYSIRSGKGSTTGSQTNPDDPVVKSRVPSTTECQSYVQVFHSVHRLSRRIMELKGKARQKLKVHTYFAAFGIKYLDNMLGGKDENTRRVEGKDHYAGYYFDTRGLPCRSTSALIGDSLTQKSTLGKAFLSHCFFEFEKRLAEVRAWLKGPAEVRDEENRVWTLARNRVELILGSAEFLDEEWDAQGKLIAETGTWQELGEHLRQKIESNETPISFTSMTDELSFLFGKGRFIQRRPEGRSGQSSQDPTPVISDDMESIYLLGREDFQATVSKELLTRWDAAMAHPPSDPQELEQARQEIATLDEQLVTLLEQPQLANVTALIEEVRLTHFAGWLLNYQAGVAVMLVTHNVHHEQLTREFIEWLHSDAELRKLNRDMPGYEQAMEYHVKGGTICRRLEIHSLSSEVLIHMVQQLVTAAQQRLFTRAQMEQDDLRYERSWPIRIVIDDFSAFRDIFPELREDPLLLPSLLFHFEREGVTTLIVDTQSGKPDTPIAERFESELRKMVHHNLYTWRVPFYGESRVAIAAIPPLSSDYAGIVRELRWESESSRNESQVFATEPATVDPHFELYTGLEVDDPRPVPLHVRFYAETSAMEKFIEIENRFLSERFMFQAHPLGVGSPCIIFGIPATGYDDVRDLAYLQRDTRLEHTLLFQVDEFWTMRKPAQHKRAGAFHPQWPYLNTITAQSVNEANSREDYEVDPNADPYELFQLRAGDPLPQDKAKRLKELRRWNFYENYYQDFANPERLVKGEDMLMDRVPFSWDFGFLLCQENSWRAGRHFSVKNENGEDELHTVRQVWRHLNKAKLPRQQRSLQEIEEEEEREGLAPLTHISWRIFIEACKKAAEGQSDKRTKPVTAFDFAQISPESFSCLILEIWMSEIYDSLKRKANDPRTTDKAKHERELAKLLEATTKRKLCVADRATNNASPELDLASLAETYWLELYKSWLLLIEVLNFSEIMGEASPLDFDFKSKNSDFSAIASRHWYKTASQCPDDIAAKESLVAVRLPGHFSVRGDWFLAVSGGSRSLRQADRALDLLSSRRSNITRLQMGLGLPTRVPLSNANGSSPEPKSSLGMLRTKLISHQQGQDNVDYQTFLKIAAKQGAGEADDQFYWLWRSSFDDYAHCNRIWHKWLSRTLLWWHRKLLRYKSVWVNSFEVYDTLTFNPPPDRNKFAPDAAKLASVEDEYRRALTDDEKDKALAPYTGVKHLAQLKVRSGFMELWNVLRDELQQARKVGGGFEKPRESDSTSRR